MTRCGRGFVADAGLEALVGFDSQEEGFQVRKGRAGRGVAWRDVEWWNGLDWFYTYVHPHTQVYSKELGAPAAAAAPAASRDSAAAAAMIAAAIANKQKEQKEEEEAADEKKAGAAAAKAEEREEEEEEGKEGKEAAN